MMQPMTLAGTPNTIVNANINKSQIISNGFEHSPFGVDRSIPIMGTNPLQMSVLIQQPFYA